MSEGKQNPTIQEIQELVIEDKYREAFLGLPEETRQTALAGMQEAFRASITAVLTENPDQYKVGIIDALEAGQLQMAATYLAAHPENFVAVQPAETATPPPKGPERPPERIKPKPTPRTEPPVPFYPHATAIRTYHDVENALVFPSSCERIANEVFMGAHANLSDWLRGFTTRFQVPSKFDSGHFARERVKAIARRAEEKLARGLPVTSLTYEERNAKFYPAKFAAEEERRAFSLQYNRGFGHLVEYTIVELLDQLKDRLGIARVLKSSAEEDMFRGSDLVVQTQTGRWYSIDLTTARHEETLRGKKERTESHQYVHLPNLKEMLKAEKELDPRDRLDVIPIVQPIDRDLIRAVTERYMNAIKAGERKTPLEIFEETVRALGKNPAIEMQGLLDLGEWAT